MSTCRPYRWVKRLLVRARRALHIRVGDESVEDHGLAVLPDIMKYAEFNGLRGEYLEFGVYKGASFVAAWRAASELRLRHMRFFAFDSFQGLPSTADNHPTTPFQAGDFRAPLNVFEQTIRRARIDVERVVISPGWFESTLTEQFKLEHALAAVAVAWIDCDLYGSAVLVLDFLFDVLEHGSVLIFRDWYCYRGDRCYGEQLAVQEWLERHPDVALIPYRPVSWNGEAFLFHRASSANADPRRLLL